MFTNRSAAFTLGIVYTSLSVFAQEDYTRFRSDATIQALGSFVTHTTQDGIQHGATDSLAFSPAIATTSVAITRLK